MTELLPYYEPPVDNHAAELDYQLAQDRLDHAWEQTDGIPGAGPNVQDLPARRGLDMAGLRTAPAAVASLLLAPAAGALAPTQE